MNAMSRPEVPPERGVSVSFRVSDLDAAIAELRADGIHPVTEVIDVGPARIVALRDPSGNMVQLSQPKDR
jgi:predicted enzyme related to lactoylglutathione lyase